MIGNLRIRMYDVGFGDCFLLSYDGPSRKHRLLLDCGMHLAGPGPRPITAVVDQIIEDARDPDGQPRLDVVVASHRHFDHIAGFASRRWGEVKVGEVWLPWTQNLADPLARRIHDRQAKAAAALGAFLALRPDPAAAVLLANSLSNDEAETTLLSGFQGPALRRFLPTGTEPETFTTAVLPGASINVLGPSRDEKVIRDMDPPPVQSYLRLLGSTDVGDEALSPFPGTGVADPSVEADPRIERLHKALRRQGFELAVALEDAVNGTSLVLAIQLGQAMLLLTGDAQWGTWQAAMGVPQWRDIISRTTFLKVGHHGSHNASPKDLVDGLLPGGIPAMVSVTPVSRWPEIPRKPLLEAFTAKHIAWVRSDKASSAKAPFEVAPDGSYIELALPS